MDKKVTTLSVKYYEGCSMTAIWAVPSLGIDPQTGKEIYRKKDGTVTYTYDVNDQVVCGDTQPKWNGNFGLNGEIHGWGWNITMNYRWGGQIYNQTLVDKVENAELQYNVDRRVLSNSFLERLKVSAYTNDLFIISSVKTERGTDYPFARTFSLSAQVSF